MKLESGSVYFEGVKCNKNEIVQNNSRLIDPQKTHLV